MVEEPTRPPGADRSPANAQEQKVDADVIHVGEGRAQYSIAGYQLVRSLGPRGRGGGQAEVFEAIQESTTQTVAVKILRRQAHFSDAARQQFRREIELLARVNHPNIVTIHEAGETSDGRLYFAMEFVRGVDLRTYVGVHRLGIEELLNLFITVCSAVDHLHRMGVVHRDLKPANILVDDEGRVKVLDLGLARPLVLPELLPAAGWAGTLPYLSPEQTRPTSDAPDSRSDVYSLGVILYDLLTGCLPHSMSGSVETILERIRHEPIPSLRKVWHRDVLLYSYTGTKCPIDRELESIVLHALSPERSDRYATAGELGRNVSRYLRSEPVEPIPSGLSPIAYATGAGLRRFARQHQVTASLFGTLVVWTLVEWVGTSLLYRWTPIQEWYERVSRNWQPIPSADEAFRDVRVIGINEESLRFLESQHGTQFTSGPGMHPSIRAAHGRLMTRLAESSGCRAVVWDFMFQGTSPFDQAFVDGARKLKAAGAEVVVAVGKAILQEPYQSEISPAIEAESIDGWPLTAFELLGWRIMLAAQRELADAVPSLSLAAFAAFRQPGARFDIRIEPAARRVGLRYFHVDPHDPRRKVAAGSEDYVAASYVNTTDDSSGAYKEGTGLIASDTVAFLEFPVPSEPTLERSTHAYHQVLAADGGALREWFRDKVIVVGNTRSQDAAGHDRALSPDGRSIAKVHGIAAALDAMLRATGLRYPARTTEAGLTLVLALSGCLTGHRFSRRPRARRIVLLGTTMAALLVSVAMVRGWSLNWNPLVAVLAIWCVGEAMAAMSFATRRTWEI